MWTKLLLNLIHECLSKQTRPNPTTESHPKVKLDRWTTNNVRLLPKSPDRINKYLSPHIRLKN